MRRREFIATGGASALIAGCASTGFDPGMLISAGRTNLLYREFEYAAEILRGYPWTPAEQAEIDVLLNELNKVRTSLSKLHKAGTERQLLTIATSRELLDTTADAYNRAHAMFLVMVDREDEYVDPYLEQYDENARRVYDAFDKALDSGVGLDTSNLTEYLRLALRFYVATKGVPLG